MRRLTIGAVAAALLALAASCAAQTPELPGASLPGLLALARQHNPDIAGLRAESSAAAERVQPAGALPDPRLRVEFMDITRGGTQNPNLLPGRAGSVKYTWMQELPWFGKRDLRRDLAQAEADGSAAREQAGWTELAARVKATQAQRDYLAGSQRLTEELLALMQRLEQVALSRYAGGLARQPDVIRAQVEQTALRTELASLAGDSAQADAQLNALLGRAADAPLAAPDGPRELPEPARLEAERLTARLRSHNPQLSAAQARVQSAERSRDLTWRNRYPDVTLGLSPTQRNSGISDWAVMVELKLPLQQDVRRAQEREAQAMLDAAQAGSQSLDTRLQAELAQDLAALQAAQRSAALAGDSLAPQAALSLQSALASYENGQLDFATLIDAQRALRQARLSQLRARLQVQLRLADIEKLIGEDV